MSPIIILFALILTTIIMTIYYFSVFSQEKIKRYSNSGYVLFILHLIVVYYLVFIVLYLFVKTLVNSKQIYPRRNLGHIKYPKFPNFNGSYFNENFNNLFRKRVPRGPFPTDKYFETPYQRIRAPQNPPYIFWDE